ncbi:MAG TPA: redoxin family protein [Pyrinomonadaceae bacterium]
MSSQPTAPTAFGPRGRRRALSLLALVVLTAAVSSCAGLSEQGASTGTTNAPNGQAVANNQPAPGTLRANASATVPGAPATSPPQVAPTPGRMALPDAVKLAEINALDGAPIRFSEFGGKVVVLNLWATWCGPCRLEIPHLVELNKEYAGRVEFVGLTTEDRAASEPLVREFVREYKMDYRVGFSGPTVALALMQNRTSIPQVFIIRDGYIHYRFIGFNPQISPPRLREGIEATLKAGA